MRPRSIILYLGIAVATAAGAIFATIWYAASNENSASLTSQEQIARFVTDDMLRDIGGKLNLMLYWQEAFEKTTIRPDKVWYEWEFGAYQEPTGINASVMLDGAGHVRYLWQQNLTKPISTDSILASAEIQSLLTALYAAPRTQPPQIARGLVEIGGDAFFSVGGRITPENKEQLEQYRDKDTYVVYLMRANAQAYRALSDSFGITGVQIAPGPIAGKVSIPLFDPAEKNRTNLWWTPDRPGDAFLDSVLPFSLAVLGVLLMVQAVVVLRWQSMQRRLYRAESAAEAAQAESRAKTAFLGVLSHELRTPLNAIIGFSEMLQTQLFGPLGSPKYAEYLSFIHRGGNNMLRTVNDLLHIAEIEAGTMELVPEPTDIEETLRGTIAGLQELAARKNIDVMLHTDGPPSWCRYGGRDLNAVFGHLIENGIKFCNEGGAVSVAIARSGGDIAIIVRDTGIGIKDADLERLGLPFSQIEGHLVRRNGGLGVGLAIAKSLIGLMGGRFTIESRFGAGTTVTVTLPAAAPAAAREAA